MLGGFNPKKDLPFFNTINPEEAFKIATENCNEKFADKHKDDFLNKRYGSHFSALELVKQRYFFYLKILGNDQYVLSKFSSDIAGLWLVERVTYAIYGCIKKGEELTKEMEEIINDFSKFYKAKEKKPAYIIEEPHTNCERLGVCMCDIGNKEPYMFGCIVNDPTMLPRDEEASFKRFKEGVSIVTKIALSKSE